MRHAIQVLLSSSLLLVDLWALLICPYGLRGQWIRYHLNVKTTIAAGARPCVRCGIPGTTEAYGLSGSGLRSPFDYHGPFIYCTRHTDNSPLHPFLGPFVLAVVLSLIGMILPILPLVDSFAAIRGHTTIILGGNLLQNCWSIVSVQLLFAFMYLLGPISLRVW